MRKIDFSIQTILLTAAVLSGIAAMVAEAGYAIFGAMAMFLIGVWQLLSAAATSTNRAHGNQYRTNSIRLYWILVAVYFVVLAVFWFSRMEQVATIWFFTAWGIAIYYYVFTIRLAFMHTGEKKTFMDIGN